VELLAVPPFVAEEKELALSSMQVLALALPQAWPATRYVDRTWSLELRKQFHMLLSFERPACRRRSRGLRSRELPETRFASLRTLKTTQ
jgi:hypothetical protein